MIRSLYTAGVARIAVLQLNSLTMPTSMGIPTERLAIYASRVKRGSDATKERTKHSEESQIKNSEN